jgi:Spy/CpxP family protein refolding chaperone
MRNRLTIAALAMLGSLLLAPVVFGQEAGAPPPPPPPREGGDKPAPGPGSGGGPIGVIKENLGKLGLTDDQSKQANELIAKFQADIKAGFEKNGDALKQIETDMKAAREAGDKAKMQALQAQRAKLLPDMRAKTEELVKQITTILTEDQAKKFSAAVKEAFQKPAGPPPPGAIVERILHAENLKLTDEQKVKIQDLFKAYQDAMKNAQGPEGKATRNELGAKLLADVKALLTAEEVAMVEKMFAPPPPRGVGLDKALNQVNLTDDQKKTLADLRSKMQEAMKNATTKDDRRALEQKFMQDVENLLTADQKNQVRKIMEAGREKPPAGGPGDGPKGPGPGGDRPGGNPPGGGQPPAGPPPL